MYSGDAAQVTCLVASGDQPLNISWSFEKQSISVLPGVTVTKVGLKTSLLLIDPVKAVHRGNYTCTVRNPAGSANYTAGLHINGKQLSIISYFPPSQLRLKLYPSSLTIPCLREKLRKLRVLSPLAMLLLIFLGHLTVVKLVHFKAFPLLC